MIEEFFLEVADGRSTATWRRYQRLRGRLLAYLGDDDDPQRVVTEIAQLVQEPWLPNGDAEARAWLSTLRRLVERIGDDGTAAAVVEAAAEALAQRDKPQQQTHVPARMPMTVESSTIMEP